MGILITSDPATGAPATTPVVVSDCLEWCLHPATGDLFETVGTFASLTVDFPATISVIPADGTEFTIWGHTFEVQSGLSQSTATAFKIQTSGSLTGAAFRQMLNANIFFAQNTVVDDDGFVLRNTVVTWNACGEQGNFTGAGMDFVALEDAGATVVATNGQTQVPVNGYSMQVRLLKVDTDTSVALPVTEFEGLLPLLECGETSPVCVNYIKDAARLLFTPMPDLDIDSEIDPDTGTLCALYLIQYGWNFKDDNCQPVSGNFYLTDEVFVVNAAFGTENAEGIMPYWALHPDFSGESRAENQWFLTNQPKTHRLSENSFAWLWFLNAFTGEIEGSSGDFVPHHFDLGITIIGASGVTVEYPQMEWFKVFNFNVSPGRVADLAGVDVSTIDAYEVNLLAFDEGETTFAIVSELLTFVVDHDCGDNIRDVYFLTPQGGIATLVCEETEREIEQEGKEICLDTPCATSRLESAKYGGRQLANLRSFETVTLRARENFGAEWVEFFRSFKASPDRYLQVKEVKSTGADTWLAKRFNPETGGIKIYQSGEYVELIAKGTLADIPTQFPRNAI